MAATLLALASTVAGQGEPSAVGSDQAPLRGSPVDTIVLHTIGGPQCRDGQIVFSGAPGDANRWLAYFERAEVIGIHHVVDRSGLALAGIAENRVANHARGHNRRSIGIELVNDGDGRDPFTSVQLNSLVRLIDAIMDRHPGIEVSRVVRHSDLDDRHFECGGRRVKLKQDPGPAFDLEGLRSRLGRRR